MTEEEKKDNQLITQEDILTKIDNISSQEELKEVTNLFNLNLVKKEMTRALQQDELIDIVLKQAGERLKKRPDELSTRDLLDYLNAFQANINKAQSNVEKVDTKPMIQVNDNKKVVVSVGGLDRDSSENVVAAIKDILKEINNSSEESIQNLLDSVQTVETSNESEGK